MDWLKYFWSGAVHVEDLAQAVLCSLDTVRTTPLPMATLPSSALSRTLSAAGG